MAIFGAATRAAADRARSVAAELRVTIAGLDVSAEIAVTTDRIVDETTGLFGAPLTRIPMSWEAAHHPRFFPLMNAVLSLYALSATETQLDFLGQYEPPMGVVGSAVDALVGRRVAEACVHRFISDVAWYLRQELASR